MSMIIGPIHFQASWQRLYANATDLGKSVSGTLQNTLDYLDDQLQISDHFHNTFDFSKDAPKVSPQIFDKKPESPKITAATRVLIIGDSQTVGPYGKTLDSLTRETGAAVVTHASWGASPTWFFDGHATNYKYWTRDEAGHQQTTLKADTPLLNNLLETEKPDVVIVTMGGNMIASGATQADVTLQVSQIGNAVSASGAELVWVGPPKYDPQKRTPELVESFYQKLENIVPEFGSLIDSRPHIEAYSGDDGLHYTGSKGERIAKQWAKGVFDQIQKLN